jgi:hypothetical protein
MTSVTIPTPVTIYSQRVQIHLDELKGAIARAMVDAPVAKLNRKSLTLKFNVVVKPDCFSFFAKNGLELLYLSGWTIDKFAMADGNMISIELTGNYESSYR